jgi:hypothetical protein
MSNQYSHNKLSNPFLLKIGLCVWMCIVIFAFLIVFWPPILQSLIWGLGLQNYLQLLQSIIKPMLTANYLS